MAPRPTVCKRSGSIRSIRRQAMSSEHDTTTLAGEDSTIGPSGACGVNKWLTIKMPFTAVKLS